jgi:ABC-type multidrug transport system permease subunit
MNTILFLLPGMLILIVFFFFSIYQNSVLGQEKIRIGTYDSRAVAVAYFNSPYGKQVMELIDNLQNQET